MSFGKNNDELRSTREAMLSGIGVTPDSSLDTVFEALIDRLRDRKEPLGIEPTLDEVEAEITQFFDAFAVAARFVRMPKDSDVLTTVVNLKYRDLGADWSFRFVREARGAIFEVLYDTSQPSYGMVASMGYAQIGYPFPKFFNLGEPYAPKFSDFADLDLRIEEKVDGSLITVCQSLYGMAADAEVIISTSGTPGAGSRMGDSSMTFADGVTAIFSRAQFQALFARLAANTFGTYPKRADATLIFELVTPQNANVVAYTEPRLCLLGAYSPATGELPPAWCDAIVTAMNAIRDSMSNNPVGVIDRPKTFALSDLSDAGVRALVGAWNGSQAEGVVVVGFSRTMGARDYALRMKVKAPDYAVKHSAFGGKSSLSWSHCLYFAAKGTLDDVLAARPLQAMRLLEAQRLLADMIREIDALFDEATAHTAALSGVSSKDAQKAFALFVNGRAPRLAGYCFGARRAAMSGKPVKASDLFLAAVVEDRTVGSSLIPDPTGIGETPETTATDE